MSTAENPDVGLGVWTPDTYVYIDTTPQNAGSGPEPKRLFLLEPYLASDSAMVAAPYSLTAGTATPNEIAQFSSVTKVNAKAHRRSGAACRFREALAQRLVGNDVYIGFVKEASGSGFTGVASALLAITGTAVGSGEIKVWLCGHLVKVLVANGDTAAVIAAALLTRIRTDIPDCPLIGHPSLISTATIGLAYIHRGQIGNDRPVMVYIPPEITGIKMSPGNIDIATNAAGAAAAPSTFTLVIGSLSLSVSIAIGTTPTNAAIAIKNAINAASLPVTADSAVGVLSLYFRNEWVVHRIQVSSTEDAGGQTYTLKDRHDHADPTAAIVGVATVAGSSALTALAGTGTPTLTSVLANAQVQPTFLEWVTEFIDATSLGAIRSHIATYGNGYNQKNQRVTLCSSEDVDTARLRITGSLAPSPDLTGHWEFNFGIAQDIPVQAATYAAMWAAEMCAKTLPYNLDGLELKSGLPNVPLYPARKDVELSPADKDVAMRSYHMTPFTGINGRVVMVRGVTTWGGTNTEWSDLSYGRIFHDDRYRLRLKMNSRLSGRVFFQYVDPRVANAFALTDVEDIIAEHLYERDGITQDGAADLAQYVNAEVDPDDGTRIRAQYRARPPRESHAKTVVVSGS